MAHRMPPRGLQGDEAELFRKFNDELMRLIRGSVHEVGHEVVEDACAFAWSRFLVCQPDRDRNWRGWLFRTAQRRAWELARERVATVPLLGPGEEDDRGLAREPADPRDAFRTRLALRRALNAFDRLPDDQKRLVALRGQGYSYQEIKELTGETYAYVNRRLVEADAHLRLLLADPHERPPNARVDRLHELERDAPEWLVAHIGRPPAIDTHRSAGTALQAWRRAALAIDDYRREHHRPSGTQPTSSRSLAVNRRNAPGTSLPRRSGAWKPHVTRSARSSVSADGRTFRRPR